MRKYVIRTLAIVLILSMMMSLTAFAEQATVTGSDVNVRSGPDSSYPVIDCLAKGTEVSITDRTNSSWFKISYNGKSGYMFSQYLKAVETTSGSAVIGGTTGTPSVSGTTGSINAMYVRFRSEPNTNSAILGTYNIGTQVVVTGEAVNGWYPAVINGQSGYIYAQYVTKNESISVVIPGSDPNPQAPTPSQAPVINPSTPSATEGTVGYINAEGVNFRSGPSSSFAVRGTFNTGKQLSVLGETDGWSKVIIDGYTGYVYSIFISTNAPAGGNTGSTVTPENPTPSTPPIIVVPSTTPAPSAPDQTPAPSAPSYPTAHITGNYVNFRSGPSSNYSIIGCYNAGQELTLKGETNGWCNVIINGREGYVFGQYVSAPDSGSPSVTPSVTPAPSQPQVTPAPTAAPTTKAFITGSDVNFRSGPSTSYSIITSFSRGTEVELISEANGWSNVKFNGNSGYVFSQYVSASNPNAPSISPDTPVITPAPTTTQEGYITGNSVRFRSGPSTDTYILGTYNYGQPLTITDDSGEWYACIINGNAGYVYGSYVAKGSTTGSSGSTGSTGSDPVQPGTNASAQDIVNYALGYVGYPYIWGGTTPAGFDCSGFVQYVYRHFGYTLKRVAADQATDGILVTGDLMPGDILCFYSGSSYIGHVGIYIGNGEFVHASNSTTGVIISSLNGYYVNRGYVARRILN